MKVTVSSHGAFERAFQDANQSLDDFRIVLREFGKSTVLVTLSDPRYSQNFQDPFAKEKLELWLASRYKSHAISFSEIERTDFRLESQEIKGNSLSSLIATDEYENRLDELKHPIESGTPRQKVYEERISKIASLSRSFMYLDAFFLEQLLRYGQESGPWYLIDKLLQSGVDEIRIETAAIFEGNESQPSHIRTRNATQSDFDTEFNLDGLQKKLSLLISRSNTDAKITINVYKKVIGELPHDRYGMFILNTGDPLYFNFGPGINLFSKPLVSEAKAICIALERAQAVDLGEFGRGNYKFKELIVDKFALSEETPVN